MNPYNATLSRIVSAVLILFALVTSLFVGGCSSINPIVPVRSTNTVVLTNLVPFETVLWKTNTVVFTNETVVTNIVQRTPVVVTNFDIVVSTNFVVATNAYEVSQEFTSGIQTAKRVNSAFNATPSAPVVDWGLSIATLVAGSVAAWKTNRARKADTARSTAELVRDTMIRAVETAPPGAASAVKKHIAAVANMAGVSVDLDVAVQKVTLAMADGKMTADEFLALANDPNVTVEMIPLEMREAFKRLRS